MKYEIIRISEFTVRGIKTENEDNFWDTIKEKKVIFETDSFEEFIKVLNYNFYRIELSDISEIITGESTSIHLNRLDCYHTVYSNSDWRINVKYYIKKNED